jgi:NAD(P)-dependent dehydrogenase (short-subunit alcohol dehydrogenase family)
VHFTVAAFLPLLQAARDNRAPGLDAAYHPSVIVISSMSGIMVHAQGHMAYNAAKAATIHLTKMMAHEFRNAGIRVNTIAPGYFPSEMTTGESDDRQKSRMPSNKIADKGHVPIGREGADEEMAQGVLFLAKNKYVNGQVTVIDGGVLLQVPG